MNPDPLTPLVKRDDDPFERALLRAGQRERAPRGADRRLLAALGVGAGAGAALSAFFGKYAAKIGTKGLLATVAISVAAVAVATWSVSSSIDAPEPSTNVVPAPATAVAPPPPASSADLRVEALPSTRVEDLPSSSPATKPAGKAAPSAPPATTATSASAEGTPNLAREIELVQGARAALTRGEASEALRLLDVHDREFPSGTLRPESRVLRIEALVRAGGERNIARANALGDAFLAEQPGGPQARRVRAVLGRDR